MEQAICKHCEHPQLNEHGVFCPQCGEAYECDFCETKQTSSIEQIRKQLIAKQQQRQQWLGQTFSRHRTAPSIFQRIHKLSTNDIVVELDVLEVFNYALYHCGIGQVHGIRILNHSQQSSQPLTLRIRLLEFGESWEETIPSLAAGEAWEANNLSPPLSYHKLREVLESTRSALKIQVSDAQQVIWSKTIDTRVLAYQEWFFHPALLHTLACFVQPNEPALSTIVNKASIRLKKKTGTDDFPGYQRNSKDHVLLMLEAIHDTLRQSTEIAYINPPASFEQTGQKIRLVTNTLQERRGTCLDLAVLQAALWERIGLAPILIIIPGHAMLGCWLKEPDVDRPKVLDLARSSSSSQHLWQQLEAGDWVLMNSVEITANQSFVTAIEKAFDYLGTLDETTNDSYIYFIDVEACRRHHVLPLP